MPRIIALFPATVLLLAAAAIAQTTQPQPERWSDPTLPVRQDLVLWIDASKQFDAWAAHDRALVTNEPIDVCYDASGARRHLSQPVKTMQPTLVGSNKLATLRFDGEDDFLRFNGDDIRLREASVFIVAATRSNAGGFRGFLSGSGNGKNDFDSGFTIDLGPPASDGMHGSDYLNIEGKGFIGARNLLKGNIQVEEFRRIGASIAGGEGNIRAYLDGKQTGVRDRRDNSPLVLNNLVVGARLFSNEDAPPYVRSQFHGDIAEVIVYDRVLTDSERAAVDAYLSAKYEGAMEALNRMVAGGTPLVPVKDPPAVQMFVPGFAARTLPVELTNINNVRYRHDGKLYALAYDGNIYLLSDSDGDGLEDKVQTFWKNADQIVAPIGLAVTPPGYAHGEGVFVACKGKVSLLVDTNNDDVADKEIVAASGWPGTFSPVDALGVAVAKDGSIYFGLGCANFVSAYQPDEQGKAQYRLDNERGTILKISPDFKKREIVCTGIRFPVGLAFNAAGDLFCTDQEGATWLANGNPFDELLHIQPGRHYGFPPRHPSFLPDVFDEPSTFDYMPQHQSTCGLIFNEGINGGAHFGPATWHGDAIVSGESRGKLWRTKLAKTSPGYVAQTALIASLPMLTIDSCVSPAGELVVAVHSGNPDWGTGPKGKGKLYKISYRDPGIPQPVLCYAAGPGEVRVAFDKPLDIQTVRNWTKQGKIEWGRYVGAGDRFEAIRPGYAVVKRQRLEPRQTLDIAGVRFSPDHRSLILTTAAQKQAAHFALTLGGAAGPKPTDGEIGQHDAIDLSYDLCGVEASWRSADGSRTWAGWLPHPDLGVSRAFTAGSAEHEKLWSLIEQTGTLTLRTALNLRNLIQPAVQPGSQLDYAPPEERVHVHIRGGAAVKVRFVHKTQEAREIALEIIARDGRYEPLEIEIPTGSDTSLAVTFSIPRDSTPRPLALRRFMLPWATPLRDEPIDDAQPQPIPQLAGGDWQRGKQLFFGNEAGCAKCHTVRGQGGDIGPDLSNLIHRDYDSVMRDIRDPSGALNPDHIASIVALKDGRVLGGIVRETGPGAFFVRGDAEGEKAPIQRSQVKKITPSPLSLMPTGLAEGLGEEKMRDILTFVMTEPLSPAAIQRKGAPPPRSRAEVAAVMTGAAPADASKPLRILLVAGPKDHGPSEHDYPDWQKRWTTLLGLAENVTVAQANEWPTAAQWNDAEVAVFYSANPAWTTQRGGELDTFLSRGGGLVFIHWAVNGREEAEALAQRIGLAGRQGIRYRHGPVELTIRDTNHPITRGFGGGVKFLDETYWNMPGDESRLHLLADAVEEDKPRPQLWTLQEGKGRVFVSIPGHYSWTFDDPLFRILILRGICWTAGEVDVDRLSSLATIGARVR